MYYLMNMKLISFLFGTVCFWLMKLDMGLGFIITFCQIILCFVWFKLYKCIRIQKFL